MISAPTSLTPTYRLNTGLVLPQIGFGTWEITPDVNAKQAVLEALEAGYRLIDTAKIYGNEHGVGEAIRESGIPRDDIIVTTKVWNDEQGYNRTLKACQKSLERLGLDYIDIYLIHWPATKRRHESWRAMERLYDEDIIHAAGVCNFTIDHLNALFEHSSFVPSINQVEYHPYIYDEQAPLLKFCAQRDILVEAYSPLRRLERGRISQIISEVAHNHDKTPHQVVLRWCIQHGTLPLSRSTNQRHMEDNADIFDFVLNTAEMESINSLSDGLRVTWDPKGMG